MRPPNRKSLDLGEKIIHWSKIAHLHCTKRSEVQVSFSINS